MSATRAELDELLRLRGSAGAIDLSSRRRVLTDLGGTHISGFRGRGMEFDEHRVYQPGDELRTIDWRVTARTGKAHVRLYREERERPVLIAVDYRPAMWFGTRRCFKSVLAAQAAALFAWAGLANGDRIGGLIFGRTHAELRPAGGRRGVMRLLHGLSGSDSTTGGGGLDESLGRLIRTARPGALVILLSDFREQGPQTGNLLRRLARHTELIIGFVSDPLERDLPPPGRYPVRSPDDPSTRVLHSDSARARRDWHSQYDARRQAIVDAARATRAHWLELPTEQDLLDSLGLAFGRRRRAA